MMPTVSVARERRSAYVMETNRITSVLPVAGPERAGDARLGGCLCGFGGGAALMLRQPRVEAVRIVDDPVPDFDEGWTVAPGRAKLVQSALAKTDIIGCLRGREFLAVWPQSIVYCHGVVSDSTGEVGCPGKREGDPQCC